MPPAATLSPPPSRLSLLKELERLQGAWTYVSGRQEMELLIAGSSFAVKVKHGPIYMGTIRLDPSQEPKVMELLVQEGPVRHQWKTALCIYELDGTHLRWCPGQPGSKERLLAFPPEDHPDYYYTVFRRERRE